MLLICRTCPRYDARNTGDFGRELSAAITEICDNNPGIQIDVRNVQCLGGCPQDGVVAVDGPGKARVRFTGLDESFAKAVVDAARAHDACRSGLPADWDVPDEMNGHLSSVTVKRSAY